MIDLPHSIRVEILDALKFVFGGFSHSSCSIPRYMSNTAERRRSESALLSFLLPLLLSLLLSLLLLLLLFLLSVVLAVGILLASSLRKSPQSVSGTPTRTTPSGRRSRWRAHRKSTWLQPTHHRRMTSPLSCWHILDVLGAMVGNPGRIVAEPRAKSYVCVGEGSVQVIRKIVVHVRHHCQYACIVLDAQRTHPRLPS